MKNKYPFILLCILPILLALVWVQPHIVISKMTLIFLSIVLLLGICICSKKRKYITVSTLIICLLSIFISLLKGNPHQPINITQDMPLRISFIQESPKQTKIFLELPDGKEGFAIFYKPKKSSTNPNKACGTISNIRETKKQLKITLNLLPEKILATIWKKDITTKNSLVYKKSSICISTANNKYFKKIDTNLPRNKKKIQNSITYEGFIKSIDANTDKKEGLSTTDLSKTIKLLKPGTFVSIKPKTFWKPILPFKPPYYGFSQGLLFYTSIQEINILPIPRQLTPLEHIDFKLIDFYKNSAYPSFYWSVLLAKKPLDKKIYQLFQRSELIHLIVISGGHIDIIISFIMFLISIFFILTYSIKNLKNPKQILLYAKELHFFKIQEKSLPLLVLLGTIMIFYLFLTESPQAGTRAIFSFILVGFIYQTGIKTSAYTYLFLSIGVCFVFYPQWVTYPLGLIYSSTAVLSLYICIPIIQKLVYGYSFLVKLLVSVLLTSFFVTLFIAPISLYYFHYYNFIGIFTNIPIGFLFVVFIYMASLASILYFIAPSMGTIILHWSDSVVSLMLKFLDYSGQLNILKVYKVNVNPIFIICFYIFLIIIIQTLKKQYDIKEILI